MHLLHEQAGGLGFVQRGCGLAFLDQTGLFRLLLSNAILGDSLHYTEDAL